MHHRSVIGGIAETRELLEICAEYYILPGVGMIKILVINDAFDKRNDKEVCSRYVIDMVSFKDAQ